MLRDTYLELRRSNSNLLPRNLSAARLAFTVFFTLAIGIWLSYRLYPLSSLLEVSAWLLAQLFVALGILQCFLLVHETGHKSLFKSRFLNTSIGLIASLFCLIPFFPWRFIHQKHHRWTGWKDRDPTTERAIPRELSPWEMKVLDFAWKWWIPLFCPIYVLDNFWNLRRLSLLSKRSRERSLFVISVALIILFWLIVFEVLPWMLVFHCYALAFFLVLILSDILMLSQHSHIHQENAGTEIVSPFPLYQQDIFTRSLVFPRWVSSYLLFGFDKHEAHHMLPHIPGYLLPELATANSIHWRVWLTRAKSIPGHKLVFLTREETGIWL